MPLLVRPPLPLTMPDKVALLPLVSIVPPPLPSVIGVAIARPAPLIFSVPPVNEALLPVQPKAPAVFATKVPPAAEHRVAVAAQPYGIQVVPRPRAVAVVGQQAGR